MKTPVLGPLFNIVAGLQLYQKEIPTQVFLWEICEVFKCTVFNRITPVAASIFYNMQFWQFLTNLKIFSECFLPLTFLGRFPFLLYKTPRISYSSMLVIHSNNPLKTYNIIRTTTLKVHSKVCENFWQLKAL